MTFVQKSGKDKNAALETEWRVGEYNRLSKEDGDKPESDSIQNQHSINQSHLDRLRAAGEKIVSVTSYSDDGYAGGTFDRPRYRDMIRDVEAGRLNCIIFKDNSRLGRNYPELGRLMEDYFPQKGVRVISVLNNLDSVKDPQGYCSAIVSFANIVNDDYIRQLSLKIKRTLLMKRERGEFTGNYAPYGYIKDPGDRHRLIIDPEPAEIVRTIFNWYEAGLSARAIAKKLDSLNVMTPGEYKIKAGCKSFATRHRNYPKAMHWAATTVGAILRDEVYIGNMVQGKFKSVSYRSKRVAAADQSEWSVVEGTHEPVINDGQFAAVHELLARHTRAPPSREAAYPMSGKLVCGRCGHTMSRVTSGGQPRYRCPTRTDAPDKCQCVSVKEKTVEAAVLQALQREIALLPDAASIVDAARKMSSRKSERDECLLAIGKSEKECERLAAAKFCLYNDYQGGVITRDDYAQFSAQYDAALLQQKERIEKLKSSLDEMRLSRRRGDEFAEYFEHCGNIRDLDRETLTGLVSRIVYHDKGHMELYFRFSAKVS